MTLLQSLATTSYGALPAQSRPKHNKLASPGMLSSSGVRSSMPVTDTLSLNNRGVHQRPETNALTAHGVVMLPTRTDNADRWHTLGPIEPRGCSLNADA